MSVECLCCLLVDFDHENGVPLTISDLTESPSEPGGKISVTLKRDSGDGLEEKTGETNKRLTVQMLSV